MAIERIKLNLIPTGEMPVCHASQYDKGRQIGLDVFSGSTPYIFTDEQLELDIRKGDGKIVTIDVPVTRKGSTVIFSTTEQMCAVAGANLCELKITKGANVIGSLNFYMEIERSPMENGLMSESEINNLDRQIDDYLDEVLPSEIAEEVPAIVEQVVGENYPTRQEVNQALEGKADATETTQALEQLETAVSGKADATATSEALGQLAEAVNGKANTSAVNEALALKADKSEVAELNNTLNKFPSDVLWNDNVLAGKLKRTFNGITTDFDVASLKPENGKTYYIKPNGNDSNSGEDREHPLQKLSTAIAKSDVQTIVVMDGIYNNGRIGGSFTKGVNIVADTDAHPIFIMSRDKTWSKTDGYTKVYQTTDSASAFYGVVKADVRTAEGDLLYFTKVDTLAEVETTDNSYYTSEHDIYINSASAPSKVYVLVSGVNCHATLSNGETIYVEGIEFIGGNYGGFRVTNGNASKKPLAIFKNCGFARSYLGNALYLQGCSGILQNCYASYSAEDGFNYHATLNVAPDTVEINCIGRHNGTTGNNTNNGSTTHDGAKILRLNCEFFDNIGPNLADVNNSLSFNYGVVSHDSAGASTNKTGFQCQGGSMYNDTCSAYNNDYNFQAYLGGTLYQHNCSGSVDTGADGKAKAY